MASLREIKNRIASVRSTRQITSAMKMVASAKLHKAQGRIENMLPYQHQLNRILTNFLSTDTTIESAYTSARPVEKVTVVAFSSNSSLCGAYNMNVAKMLEEVVAEYHSLGKENIAIYPVGKKIEEAVKKMGYTPKGSFQSMAEKPSYEEARKLAEELMDAFVQGQTDRIVLVYHHFKSTGTQILLKENFLPIDLQQAAASEGEAVAASYNSDYIVEPAADRLVAELLPKVLCQKIYTVLLDSSASEHAARMLAMQTATDNANDLIQDLTKQYNKGRQQAITNELLDIIGGSLK